MAYDNILFEVRDGVGVLTFNRPKSLHALNEKTLDEFAEVIEHVRGDESVRVLVLTGAGDKAFVAGADIKRFQQMNPFTARLFVEKGQEICFRIEALPIPVIACVNGFAFGGGCELAMSCDFIYASETARFGQPEINLGLMPGFGGSQRLSRLVGRAKAKELCMTGEAIDARQAMEIGLASRVFPADRLVEETMKVAKDLAIRSQLALRAIKIAVDRGADVDLKSGCSLEAEAVGLCFGSRDAREGIAAFVEKRQPHFQGSLKQ